MVKIILDARKIEDYGIGVYAENLFQGIINSNQHRCRVLHLRGTRYLMAQEGTFIEVSFRNYDLREHLEIPLKIRKLKDFSYFSPHYVFPLYIKNQLLVTVHDLIHFKFSHLFKPQLRVRIGRFFMHQVKKRAKMVFAVSQKTWDDLVEIFGFGEDRIKVIYNGLSDIFFQESRKASLFPFPYVIYVGNLKPHKNLITLLRAFSMIRNTFPDLRLFLAGSIPDKDFMLNIKELGLEQRVLFRPYLQQTELIGLLDGAEFFIFPSFYEGFGFPPLEAMARKKAVISSPGGSLREILGESALYFKPDSCEELAEKMSILIENEELRKAFEEKGYAHSLSFRWDKTVKQYLTWLQKLG
jgi:glycosyltransferase involved in cell wall biosynthesis